MVKKNLSLSHRQFNSMIHNNLVGFEPKGLSLTSEQGVAGLGLLGALGQADGGCWERRSPSGRGEGHGGVLQCLEAEAGYMRGTEWPEGVGVKAAGLGGSVVCG